jgi:hypothetical protein
MLTALLIALPVLAVVVAFWEDIAALLGGDERRMP